MLVAKLLACVLPSAREAARKAQTELKKGVGHGGWQGEGKKEGKREGRREREGREEEGSGWTCTDRRVCATLGTLQLAHFLQRLCHAILRLYMCTRACNFVLAGTCRCAAQ